MNSSESDFSFVVSGNSSGSSSFVNMADVSAPGVTPVASQQQIAADSASTASSEVEQQDENEAEIENEAISEEEGDETGEGEAGGEDVNAAMEKAEEVQTAPEPKDVEGCSPRKQLQGQAQQSPGITQEEVRTF
jgi:hypothetical protein